MSAPATHWLLFPQPPATEELEALALSRALGVARVDDRTLGWQPGVLLTGPLTQEELAGGGDLPTWVGAVYSVVCPRERGAAIPAELQLPGSVLTTFPHGEPVGAERQTLETMEAIARRLGGGVLSETGVVVIPEPFIDLVLFTTTWLAEQEATQLLAPIADLRGEGGPALPPGIEVDGYGLVASGPEDSVLSLSASPADALPPALSGYEWAREQVYVYELRHYPAQTFEFAAPLPATPAAAEAAVAAAAAEQLEELAAALFTACGGPDRGHLVDDDGFLVVLE